MNQLKQMQLKSFSLIELNEELQEIISRKRKLLHEVDLLDDSIIGIKEELRTRKIIADHPVKLVSSSSLPKK